MLALKKLISPQEESESFFSPSPFCVETIFTTASFNLCFEYQQCFCFEEKLIGLISGSTQWLQRDSASDMYIIGFIDLQ